MNYIINLKYYDYKNKNQKKDKKQTFYVDHILFKI